MDGKCVSLFGVFVFIGYNETCWGLDRNTEYSFKVF